MSNNIQKYIQLFFLPVFFTLIVSMCRGQVNDDVIKNIRLFDFNTAEEKLTVIENQNPALFHELQINILLNKNRGLTIKSLDNKNKFNYNYTDYKEPYLSSLANLNAGLFNFFYIKNSDEKVINHLNLSLKQSQVLENKPLICEVIKGIINYYMTMVYLTDSKYDEYFKIYKNNIYDNNEEMLYNYYKNIIVFEKTSDSKIIEKVIPKIVGLSKKIKIKPYLGRIYVRIGNYHIFEKNDLDSAKYYYQKSISLLSNPKEGYLIEQFIKSNSNYARLLTSFKEYKKSNQILYGIRDTYNGKLHEWNKVYINYYIAFNYKNNKQFDSAFYYLDKSRLLEYDLNQKKHLASVSEINTQYQTEKKEKEIVQQKTTIKNSQYLIFGSLGLLLAASFIGFLVNKNSRRKRLLAEKNNEIEQQKVITLLKEQELTSIDAMIEGQEKERKRIAEDLHDDLGSVLTTLKLHFENYKVNKNKQKFSEDELIGKTDALLDEAYKKVRGIAHAKNSGVIANQGLLLAIENMAEKVSSSKKIKIEVVNHGLENRLENSLELTIFRVIQELITNIIKHAEASQATIHIITHEESLNIMVEDNGKGFDTSKISSKGMGIHSIDKRIEHLEGTMTIESEPNKGTTVIIDIPL